MEVPERAERRAAAPAIDERYRGTGAALHPFGAIIIASTVPAHGLRFAVSTRRHFTRGYSPPPLQGEGDGGAEIHPAEFIFEADLCLSANQAQVSKYRDLRHLL